MKKTIIALLLLIAGYSYAKAQTPPVSPVQIIDLYGMHVTEVNESGQNNESVKLNIGFKIKNVAQAKTAHFSLGSAADLGDVMSLTGNVVSANGAYKLELNGNEYAVKGYEVRLEIVLTKAQFNTTKYITLFVKDVADATTAPLHFKLN